MPSKPTLGHGDEPWFCNGRFRLRVGWFGRVFLERQEERRVSRSTCEIRWRRAPWGEKMMMPYFGADRGNSGVSTWHQRRD